MYIPRYKWIHTYIHVYIYIYTNLCMNMCPWFLYMVHPAATPQWLGSDCWSPVEHLLRRVKPQRCTKQKWIEKTIESWKPLKGWKKPCSMILVSKLEKPLKNPWKKKQKPKSLKYHWTPNHIKIRRRVFLVWKTIETKSHKITWCIGCLLAPERKSSQPRLGPSGNFLSFAASLTVFVRSQPEVLWILHELHPLLME